MSITLDQIKSLRDKTGVSISACKGALEEAGGDEDKAIEILRKKGEAKALSRADRDTGEGAVAVASEGKKTAMLMLACETDFVAKSPEFIDAVEAMTKKVLAEGKGVDLSAEVTDLGTKMGEKVESNEPYLIEGDVVGSYVHSNRKIGAVVSLEGGTEDLAKDVAMHLSATQPSRLTPDEVPTELVEKEMVIWKDEVAKSGKPEDIWDKILTGKEKKFREENALLTQSFVKNPELTVGQYLEQNGAKVKDYMMMAI